MPASAWNRSGTAEPIIRFRTRIPARQDLGERARIWGHPSIALRPSRLPEDMHTERSSKLRAVLADRRAQHFFQILRNKTKIPGVAWQLRKTSPPSPRAWTFDGCPVFRVASTTFTRCRAAPCSTRVSKAPCDAASSGRIAASGRR